MKKYTDKMDSPGQWEPIGPPHIPSDNLPRPRVRGCPKCGEAMNLKPEREPDIETLICTACGYEIETEMTFEPPEFE